MKTFLYGMAVMACGFLVGCSNAPNKSEVKEPKKSGGDAVAKVNDKGTPQAADKTENKEPAKAGTPQPEPVKADEPKKVEEPKKTAEPKVEPAKVDEPKKEPVKVVEPKATDKTPDYAAQLVAHSDPLKFAREKNKPGDWPQWGGSSIRNNVPEGKNIPTDFDPGEFDDDNGNWKTGTGKHIKWVARLGSQSYGNAVIANGKIYAGTNNGMGYDKRYPAEVDLGCLVCFDVATGKFLWQDSSEKLPTGRVHDWPQQGICCAPCVEGDHLWYVTSRGEVKCLDTNGDTENPGRAKNVWVVNMMKEWGTSQHNMCACSVTIAGDVLFVCTGNGVDEGHINIPALKAPSFVALDKNTGKLLWKDNSPGTNILHGQWSSPAFAVIDGVPQVIFGGGDGWIYGFDARGENGQPKLLWKFDANPKDSVYTLNKASRNHIIGTPVVHDNKVYVGVGEDPEHGEGVGHLYCLDPLKRGDISRELAVDAEGKPLAHRREQAIDATKGERAIANPNVGAIWHYEAQDRNGNGKIEFEETMHRTCGTVGIKNDLLFVADFSGLVHCLDAKSGKCHWTYDMKACSWASPCIVEDKVYFGNEDGVVLIFKLSDKFEKIAEVNMGNTPIYSTPVVANNVLYISNQAYLFAIEPGAKGE